MKIQTGFYLVRMGCIRSIQMQRMDSAMFRIKSEDDVCTVSPKDKEIIKDVWQNFLFDHDAVGIEIFERFFQGQNDVKKFFRQVMTEDENGQFLVDRELLEGHASKFMTTFNYIISNIDDLEECTLAILMLGERHSENNISFAPIYFIWIALRDTIKSRLGPEYNTETELAWKHIFDFISKNLTEGHARATAAREKAEGQKATRKQMQDRKQQRNK